MYIIAKHSHKNGKDFISTHHPRELKEVKEIIEEMSAKRFMTKVSEEKNMRGRLLYSPSSLNKEFKKRFNKLGWKKGRIKVKTNIPEIGKTHEGYREIDFVKNKQGLELQFGKYAFMVYNILAKATIFAKQGIVDSLIEIVAMKDMVDKMSSGVSFFEMVKTDLEYRGESNIDIPVLLIGIDARRRGRQTILG